MMTFGTDPLCQSFFSRRQILAGTIENEFLAKISIFNAPAHTKRCLRHPFGCAVGDASLDFMAMPGKRGLCQEFIVEK